MAPIVRQPAGRRKRPGARRRQGELLTLRRPWRYRPLMTKADIVENVYEKVGGFSKKEAAEIVETVFDTIKETLERGEKIKISGFGNFVVRDKNARAGRNPQTGQEITISARRVLTFKPSQVLKNALNG
jgi:integration host factor subunit alpha